jgi:hypothetical protein
VKVPSSDGYVVEAKGALANTFGCAELENMGRQPGGLGEHQAASGQIIQRN